MVDSKKRYKAYPEYKDSGVEWLGEIPSGWEVKRHKYIARFDKGKNPKNVFDNYVEGYYPYLSMDSLRGHSTSKYAPLTESLYLVNNNQPLVIWDGSNAGEFVYGREGILSSTMAAASLISLMDYQYYWYLCKCIEPEMRKHATGMGIPHVNSDELKNIGLIQPSMFEQKQIANFLDHETAKIDTLIEKQECLIELLTEKRQAAISHAVTKGLTPDVAMKDSGVEWLGEVPAHWEITKLGYVSRIVRGGSPRPAGDPALFNGDYSPWVTVGEITKDNKIYLEETATFLTKKGSEQCRVFSAGTLLLSNSGATLGVPKILTIDANANDGVLGFEDLTVNSEYIYFYLTLLTVDLRERIKQGSGQPNLNTDIVREIPVAIPPKVEMDSIVKKVKIMCHRFDKLASKAKQAIQLMQERRTALISAAVTGKIDVRDWVKPE